MDKPRIFTDEDLAVFRAGMAEHRVPGAYEENKWMVSKYNRDEKIVGKMPKSVRFRDLTLRTMEQAPGVIPSDSDRERLLRAIVETGVQSIQPSAFRRGRDHLMKREVEIIRSINPDCEIEYGDVTSEAEIEMAAEAGYDSVMVWTTYLGAAAPICASAVYHRAWQDREWRNLNFPKAPEDQIARSIKFIEMGKKHGIKVQGAVNLLAICDESYVDSYCREVSAAGAPEIDLADGSAGVGPEAFGHLTRVAREAASPNCEIAIHAHNMFGLSLACAIEAVKAGAALVEVGVNELENHPGNPDLAVAAVTFEAIYGVDTGIKLGTLFPLARLAEEITGYKVQWNHPVTGLYTFDHGGDAYVQEQLLDPLIHNSITMELVGGSRANEIGLTTGPFTMWDKLVELGIDVDSKTTVERVLKACKARLGSGKRGVSDEDVLEIVKEVANES